MMAQFSQLIGNEMTKYYVEHDFRELIAPHGEDDVSFSFDASVFEINIRYEEDQHHRLRFENCVYQAFHPIPGVNILNEEVDFWKGNSACVYRVEHSRLLNECKKYWQEVSVPYETKYFYCRFDASGMGYHVFADSLSAT